MDEKIGVDIFQPIVPEYRKALFDGVAKNSCFNVGIQASRSLSPFDFSVPLNRMAYDYDHEFLRLKGVVWQKRFQFKYAKKRGDVVVICGDLHQLSSLWIAFRAKLNGFGVVWWGHHVSACAKTWAVQIRLVVIRIFADCVLCYTDTGINFFLKHGFSKNRVFATGNTLDLKAIEDARNHWLENGRLERFKTKNNIHGKRVLLFSSVLRSKTQLDVLIRALPMIEKKYPDICCVVVGEGELLFPCQKLASELKVAEKIRWLGRIHEQSLLAPWFLSAQAFVYPGAVGLSIVHAMAYGLPVIVNKNIQGHGPEYVLFEDRENGLGFEEEGIESLAGQVNSLLAIPLEKRQTMGRHGRERVFKEYTMTRMIERFSEAIIACAHIKKVKGQS